MYVKLPRERSREPVVSVPSAASTWGAFFRTFPRPAHFARASSSAKENSSLQSRNDSDLGSGGGQVHSAQPRSTHAQRLSTSVSSSLPLPSASGSHHATLTPTPPQGYNFKGLPLLPSSTTNLASGSSRECSKSEPSRSISAVPHGPTLPLGQTSTLNVSSSPRLSCSHGHASSLNPAIGVSSHYAPWGYSQDSGQNARPITAPPAWTARMTPDWQCRTGTDYAFQS